MKKLLDIGENFANTQEPSLQILELGGTHNSLEKVAEYMSEAYKFATTMEPKEGHTYILVIAMGSGEYYGANKNQDYFPEKDLKEQYKNFETTYVYNKTNDRDEINGGALFFKHHKNKVAKGHPWFGTVHKAFYNDKMKRVELIIDIHNDRDGAQELVDKVHSGGSLSVSMGVNIPYDQCSICGNQASKQKDYCEHLKYELGRTKPDGRKVYAINGGYDYAKRPKALNFFDISYVYRPADRTGYMLKKVAMQGDSQETIEGSATAYEKLASLQEKSAALKKLSEITKYFEGQPFAVKDSDNKQLKVINRNPQLFDNVVSQMQELSPEHYKKLSKYPMQEILSSLSDLGILLTTPEFIKMIVYKKTGKHLDNELLKQCCKDQSSIFEELSKNPEMVDELHENMDMLKEGSVNPDIQNIVSDIQDSRDMSDTGFAKKAGISLTRSGLDFHQHGNPYGDQLGMHHTETITDPKTGKEYTASMAAIEDARTNRYIKDVVKIVGGAALLSGAYAYLKSLKSPIAPALGIGTLALGAKALYDNREKHKDDDQFTTHDGMQVPGSTDFFEKKSGLEELKGKVGEKAVEFSKKHGPRARTNATLLPGLATFAANKYYQNRLQHGTAGTYRTDLEKHMDNAGRIAYEHPILSTAGGMAAGHIGLNALSAARKLLGKG